MAYIRLLNKVFIFIFLLICICFKTEEQNLFKKAKEKLTQKSIVYFNNCRLIKSDLPNKYFYNYVNTKVIKIDRLSFCELIFGSKEKNKSSYLYIGINNLRDTFFIAEKKEDRINKNILFTKNDTLCRELNISKFDNYIAKLIRQDVLKNDTIYKIAFTEKPTIHLSSHMKFYPLKQLDISFSKGIQKILIENKCYSVIYE